MTRRPLLLDLFCGAGGASVGYDRAGFDVIGWDVVAMPNYPFEFRHGDALSLLRSVIRNRGYLPVTGRATSRRVAAIHASPPCQASTALTKGTNRVTRAHLHDDLIPATRELLVESGIPYVIENVQGSSVRRDVTLCGEQFGLDVIRHRYFECSFPIDPLPHLPHRGRVAGMRHGKWYTGPYFAVYGDGGGKGTVAQWQTAMGIDWTDIRSEIANAIPPAYTEYVGAQLMSHLLTSDCVHGTLDV